MNNLLPENSPFTFTRVGLAETGCDSTIILDLEVLPSVEHNIVASICDNEVYNENGFNFTEPGVYRTYNNAANGCDSITILTLVVNPTYVVNDAVESLVLDPTLGQLLEQERYQDEIHARIHIEPGQSGNALIASLLPQGELLQFDEVFPSMNDIFIETVTGKPF